MRLLVPILIGVIVLGGTVIGLGYAGVINIPGVTAKKRTTPQAATSETEAAPNAIAPPDNATDTAAAGTQSPSPRQEPEPTVTARSDGTDRLAKVWAEMDTDVLVKLLAEWTDGDALAVIAKMDDKKIAEILNALPPDRAARISVGIKALEKGGK